MYVNVVITNQVPQTLKKVIFEENHLVEIKTNLSMEGLEQKNARDASLKHPWNKQREGFLGSIFARHVPPFSGCKRLTCNKHKIILSPIGLSLSLELPE